MLGLNLQSLPIELFDHLSIYLSNEDLALLSLVSKRLHQILERQLYRDITLCVDKTNGQLRKLSGRVSFKPDLAKLVRRLSVEIVEISGNDLVSGFEFLRHLKALEHFELNVNDYDDDGSNNRFIFNSVFGLKYLEVFKQSDYPLSALKSCILNFDLMWSIRGAGGFLQLPNLQHLEITGAYFMTESCPWSSFVEKSTSVTELKLSACYFEYSYTNPILRQVLSLPRSLKRLLIDDITFGPLEAPSDNEFFRTEGGLSNCLQPVFETLEYFKLNKYILTRNRTATPVDRGMRQFKALHTLSIDFSFLLLRQDGLSDPDENLPAENIQKRKFERMSTALDWGLFLKSAPPKLKVLELFFHPSVWYGYVLVFLQLLLDKRKEFFPDLQEVKIQMKHLDNPFELTELEMLIEHFKEHGVLLH